MTDLSALPPEERLQAIIAEWTAEAELLSTVDVRKLFASAWLDGRGSVDDHSPDLLRMLHWIAPVRDLETYLAGTLTIFRAADRSDGMRWTLDEAAATADAQAAATTLFRASVEASEVLGHFTAEGSNEVLIDPVDLSSLARVSPT